MYEFIDGDLGDIFSHNLVFFIQPRCLAEVAICDEYEAYI